MWNRRTLLPLPFDGPGYDRSRDQYFQRGMNQYPTGNDTYNQRYQGHLSYNNREKEPLDVQNRFSKWNRFEYNNNREFQRSDSRQTCDLRQQRDTDFRSQRWNEVNRDEKLGARRSEFELNESRAYNKYKPFRGRGQSRGRYRGGDRDQQDRGRSWNKRGGSFHKMQAKRPSDIEIERHEKKRRLMEGCSFQDGRNRNVDEKLPSNDSVISEIVNLLEKRERSHEGKHRSSSRESCGDSRHSSSREGSQSRSSKDRKIVKSSKSDSDKSHSNHSSKDARKRHNSSARSSTERQIPASDASKSTDKTVNTKLISANELPKQKVDEEKKKEKVLSENITIPANPTTSTCVLKSVSVEKVFVSDTKSFSKGPQDKSHLKSASKHSNVVHIKPKLSLKKLDSESSSVSSVNKLTDTALKCTSSSSASSSNSEPPKKHLPKIPKIQNNTGGSKNVTINETKKLSTKHHRHSLASVPLQPSKTSISSGSSVEGNQLKKKKHRHSSGHVSESSPKKTMIVTSQTVSEVTNNEMNLDASTNILLSERDESLPHLVHRKRHSRISGSKSPPQNNVTEKTVGASGLFQVNEKGIEGKEDVKKASKTSDEGIHRHKTTDGKENIVTSNVSKTHSKSKDHDKHRTKVKSLSKKTVSNSKEHEKHCSSTKTADKEKVLDAAKKSSNLEKHSKSIELLGEKKSKLTGSHKKEGNGKDFSTNKSHKNPGDLSMEPIVCVKKLPNKTTQKVPSEAKREKTKTVESIAIEKEEVGSSAPITPCVDTKESVSSRERMSLFDLFKDSSEEQTQRKPSKLSLKRTPDKLRKGKPTSSTKPTTEQTKSHKNKRKIEEKPNENFVKKAKLPHDEEEVSSTELGSVCSEVVMNVSESSVGSDKTNTICDKIDSEKFVPTSVSAMETDISSSGVSEKDMHNESDRSISSSGRHMDESGSGCTSFSLSSCMSSPSFNKSDAMLSDNCSEMETTCNTSELLGGHSNGDVGQSIKAKNSECDSNKGMSSLDLYDNCRSLSVPDTNASESDDDDDDEGGRLVIDFNPSVTSQVDTETKKNSTRKERETLEVRGDSPVTRELETSECSRPVEDIEIPLEMRESCLDRTNQMDETLPYNLDDEQNSSVDQHQSAAFLQSETSTPLPRNSSGKIPPMDDTVPCSSITMEDSSVDLHQTNILHNADSSQQDQPLASSGNSTEIKGNFPYSQDGKNESSEDTDSIIRSSSPPQDLHHVSHEQTTQLNVMVPSSSDTTEKSSVNHIQSDTSPKSDTTAQSVPVKDDPIDTKESQQMNNDNLTFKFPKSNEQKHSDENMTPSDDLTSSQDDMMDVSDFDDKGDIRLIMYNGGDIESPWTPMPATPYVCYSQDDDDQDDESLPDKETVSVEKEITQNQEKTLNLDQENDKRQDQESDNTSVVEQLEQKPILLATVSDEKQSSDSISNGQIQTKNIVHNSSSSNEIKAKLSEKNTGPEISEFPVTVKVEPVEDSCVTVATEHPFKTHTDRIRQASMTRSSSADQLMTQNRGPSKPSVIRSQSVGGESNASLPELHHDQRPSVSVDPSPSDVALTTEATVTTTTTSALENNTVTAIVDSFNVAEISSILKCGTLTTEQHGFLTHVSKGLDHLSLLGCSSLQIPLKHDKISIDNNKITSFGNFSLVHLKDKSLIRCIECQECSDILSPREFIVHLCGSVRHMQFEIDKLLRTTFEFCTCQSDSSITDKCARALLILIFKLERSIYRSCQQQSSVCQTVSSPSAETALSSSPLTTPSSAKNLSGVDTSSPTVILEKEQPSFCAASSHVDFLTTDPPATTQSSSVASTPQGNELPTVNTLDETISTSLAFGEYLSNLQGVGGSQPGTGLDGAVVTSAWTQATGQHSLTSQVGGQPLQHDGKKSVAPASVGFGQQPKAPTTGYRSTELEQMLQCMQQSSALRRNSHSQQSFTNIDNMPPGSTPLRVRRLSKNAMEGQRSNYGQSRVEDPESRVYKPPADPAYQGPGVRDRTRPGHQLAAFMFPDVQEQSRPGNNVMPSTSSRTSFNQGGQMSGIHSRTLGNVNPTTNLHATNPFQSGSYTTGQMPNHGSGQYLANNTSARLTTGVGYTRPPLNNGPNATTTPFGPGGNFGPYNRMAAQTSMAFQSSVSNIGPQGIPGPQYNNTTVSHSTFTRTGTTGQCRNGIGLHGIVGPPNNLPQNMLGPQGSSISGPQSALGLNSSPQNMLGSQGSNITGPQSALGPNSSPQNMLGSQGSSISGPQSALGPNSLPQNMLGPQGSSISGPQSALGPNSLHQNMLGSQGSSISGPQSALGPNSIHQNMLEPQGSNILGPPGALGPNSSQLPNMLGQQQSNTIGSQSSLCPQQSNTVAPQSTLDPLNCTSSTTTQRTSGVNSASGPSQPSSVAQSSEAVNGSENHDRFSPSVQEKFWVSLGDKIQSEADAYQMFIMGQMMQRKAVEWFRDTLQTTRVAMEKMDKEHKEEMRKRKESEEIVNSRFNKFKSIVESFTKKPS